MKPALLLLALALPAAAQQPAPDTIYFHGQILTGAHLTLNDFSPTPARVAAIAIFADKILAVGTDQEILALKAPNTALIDLHNAFAMPGFNDAHTHTAMAGQQALSVSLDNVPSLTAMQEKIRAYAATLPPGAWIQGGGWDHTKWPSKALPTRNDIDAATGNHPTLLWRTDGHIALANTAALRAANITADTPNPSGGQIDHAPDGSPTGILRETPAVALIQTHIPPPASETRRKAIELSLHDALSHGVTSLQDFSDWDDWLVYEELEHEHKLTVRVAEWIDFNLPLPVLEARRKSHDPNDPLLHLTQLKAFMDGSLGSRTAALNDPYADDPANDGITRYDQQKLNQQATARAAAGFQLGFHAIGDQANDMALNAFAAAEQAGQPATSGCLESHNTEPGCQTAPRDPDASIVISAASQVALPADFRFRIEHAQVVSPGAFDRFRELGVIASMQPSHLLTDMAWAGQRLGPDRSKRAYAWHSFLDHGVTLAFGTDYPVESINPMRGLYAAITRQNEAGTQTFEPQEKLTLNQALYAYTQGSAFAEFREHSKGRLEPGFLADFIVLDRDLTQSTAQQILHTHVLRTVVGGQTRYTAPTP